MGSQPTIVLAQDFFNMSLTWHHDEALHVVLQPGPLAAGQRVTAADGAAHLTLAIPGHLRSHVIIIRHLIRN